MVNRGWPGSVAGAVTEAKLLVAAPDFPGVSVSCRYRAHHLFAEELCLKDCSNRMHPLVIFGIALFVFGPRKLPELGKGIGDGIRGFKSARSGTAAEEPAGAKTDVVKD
jgi:sec-independent protein translocase protein TatA